MTPAPQRNTGEAVALDMGEVFTALSIKAMTLREILRRVDLGNQEDVPLVQAARDLAGQIGQVADSAARAAGGMTTEGHWAGWVLGARAADSMGRLELGEG